jgi:hypothetical protein
MTDPSRDILDRNLSSAAIAEAATIASSLLTEIVNYGTALLSRCRAHLGPLPPRAEDRSLLVLLRQVIESTDVTQLLAQQGTLAGVDPNLRASLEAFLSISYIVAGDVTARQRRGRAYMLFVLRQHRRDIMARIPGTPEHAELLQSVADDQYVEKFVPKPDADDKKDLENIERELASADLAAIAADFELQRKKRKREARPKWYRLDDGPSNIQELAVAVRQQGVYEVLYRSWSMSAHAQDVALPNDAEWLRLRSHRGFKPGVSIAVWLAVESFRRVLETFRPSDWSELKNWYNAEVRPRRESLDKTEIPDVPWRD